ncbi:MAG: TadE/TadG family type IV pilus assembly protein [Sheuella sp.]|nr:TadE/TadG family type IV pilus assembly protein [Sheuella sp.]
MSKTRELQKGIVSVEFALILPVLMILLLGLIDFGRLTRDKLIVINAANAGARFGSLNPINFDDDNGIINAALSSGLDLPILQSDITVAPRSCYCITNNGLNMTLMASCFASCTGVGVDPTPAKYVTVSTGYFFNPLFTWPLILQPTTITASSTMREQ